MSLSLFILLKNLSSSLSFPYLTSISFLDICVVLNILKGCRWMRWSGITTGGSRTIILLSLKIFVFTNCIKIVMKSKNDVVDGHLLPIFIMHHDGFCKNWMKSDMESSKPSFLPGNMRPETSVNCTSEPASLIRSMFLTIYYVKRTLFTDYIINLTHRLSFCFSLCHVCLFDCMWLVSDPLIAFIQKRPGQENCNTSANIA